MVRLVYTLTLIFLLCACSTTEPIKPIETSVLRLEKDMIREVAQSEIMHQKPSANVDPDVALIRKIFTTEYINKAHVVSQPYTPKIHIYTNKAITLEEAVFTMARTIGYEPVFSDTVDRKQKVIIRNIALSLQSFTRSLEYQTHANVHIFPESGVVLVTKKFKKLK